MAFCWQLGLLTAWQVRCAGASLCQVLQGHAAPADCTPSALSQGTSGKELVPSAVQVCCPAFIAVGLPGKVAR
jgi:hypothetical protein